SETASSCSRRNPGPGTCTDRTPCVFCATSAVVTAMPYAPCAQNALRSAWIPAPPVGSVPATESTRGREGASSEVALPGPGATAGVMEGTVSGIGGHPFAGTSQSRFDGCDLSPACAGHPVSVTASYDAARRPRQAVRDAAEPAPAAPGRG